MTKFYHELWVNCRTPIESLREAQLLIYRRPDLVDALAGERGAFQRQAAVRVESSAPHPSSPEPSLPRTPVKLWAAFVVFGVGK